MMNADARKATVLVLDDDAAFRSVLQRALARLGYCAVGAETIASCLRVARRLRPEFAVVDLRLRGESGLQAVADLHALNPVMRILVLTGYASVSTAVAAMRAGAIDYLSKPADAAQIADALTSAHDADPPQLDLPAKPVRQVEWEYLQRVLHEHRGNISETARALGLHRRSLQRKLAKAPGSESPGGES